jgi:hypothetical protein
MEVGGAGIDGGSSSAEEQEKWLADAIALVQHNAFYMHRALVVFGLWVFPIACGERVWSGGSDRSLWARSSDFPTQFALPSLSMIDAGRITHLLL